MKWCELSFRIAKNGIILKFLLEHVLIQPSTSVCCNSGFRIYCLLFFSLSLNIIYVCPVYSSYQSQSFSQLKGTYFLLTLLGACCLQLINFTLPNAPYIRSEVFNFSKIFLLLRKLLGLFGLTWLFLGIAVWWPISLIRNYYFEFESEFDIEFKI